MTRITFIRKFSGLFFVGLFVFLFYSSCEHQELIDSSGGNQNLSVDSIARFSWIQVNIFDQKCALPGGCHLGGNSPNGLNLSEGNAYGNLVEIAAEGPQSFSILRVKPGDPDSSYLVWKIEDHPDIVGDRMPHPNRFPDPLPQVEINAIRKWIRGATFNKD